MTIEEKKGRCRTVLIQNRQASFRTSSSQHNLTDCFVLSTDLASTATTTSPAHHWPFAFPSTRPITLPFGRDTRRTAYNEIIEVDVALMILALIDALYNASTLNRTAVYYPLYSTRGERFTDPRLFSYQ
jgi:hypothetical protein